MLPTELMGRMMGELSILLDEMRDGLQPSNPALYELVRSHVLAEIQREALDAR
jgi:hypothetical protein